MAKRQERHQAIRTIVRENVIRTQQELADQLQKQGFECTQATISRDIADLGLVKSRTGRYALPEEIRLRRLVSDLVVEVHAASNLVIIKSTVGGAAGVCAALDEAKLPGVLGTVAGDDTILLVADTPDSARSVEQAILMFKG